MKRVIVALLIAVSLCLAALPAHSAAPVAPKLYYTTNGLDLSVQWAEVPGATSYTLYYAPHPFTGNGIGSFDMGAATSLNVSLWEGAAYYIAVVANNSEGSSGLSNIQQFVTSTVIPSAPQLIYDPSGTCVTISWDPSARVTGYRLSFMPSAYTFPWEFMSLDMGAQTSFSYDHLQVGQTYTVAVQAYNAHGTSGYSNIETFTVPDPQPPRYVTVSGPSGVTLETPVHTSAGGSNVSLSAGGNVAGFADPGETLVSPVINVLVEGGAGTSNEAPSTLSIPVDPAYRSNPDKLIVRVKLTSGAVVPVSGYYDAVSGTYRVQVNDFTDSWQIALVHNPLQMIYRGSPTARLAPRMVTPMDWRTYDWEVVVDNPSKVSASDINLIQARMKKASINYAEAGFRSPRIFVNPSLKRAVNIKTTGFYDENYYEQNGELGEAQAFESFYDARKESLQLGQISIDWVSVPDIMRRYGWTLDHLLAHELFHAIQAGYDIKYFMQDQFNPYTEGTATTIAVTYSKTTNVSGGAVFTRDEKESEKARLDETVDDSEAGNPYSRQDFFAYLAKRYAGGSFVYLHNLFNRMHDLTASRPDMLGADAQHLLRSAMTSSFNNDFNVSLAEAYFTYVEDRAYRHSAAATLRPEDQILRPMVLNSLIFNSVKNGTYERDLSEYRTSEHTETLFLRPLLSGISRINIPSIAESVSIPLKFSINNGNLGPEFIKVLIFSDGSGAEPVEVMTLDEPVLVPVNSATTSLTVLAMNGYVSPNRSFINFTVAKPEIVSVSPENPRPGDQVTITGKLFGERVVPGYSKLLMNGNLVEPTSWTDTEIRFPLPPMGEGGTQSQNTIFIENLAGASNSLTIGANISVPTSLSVVWNSLHEERDSVGTVTRREEEQVSYSTLLPQAEIIPRDYVNWAQVCGEVCTSPISVFSADNHTRPWTPADIGRSIPISPVSVDASRTTYTLVNDTLKPTYKCIKRGAVTDTMSVVDVDVFMKRPAVKEYVLSIVIGGFFNIVTAPDAVKPVCQSWDEPGGTWRDVPQQYGFNVPYNNKLEHLESVLSFPNGMELETYLAAPLGSRIFVFTPTVENTDIGNYSRTNYNVTLTVNPGQ